MTCRAKNRPAIAELPPAGCSGSPFSEACVEKTPASVSSVGPTNLVEMTGLLKDPPDLGEPVATERMCQTMFRGMKDTADPQASNPEYAKLIQNCYPIFARDGSRIVGRPGLSQAGAQLGSGGTRRVQGIYQFTKLDGTEYTIAIVGGQFYTYNWGTDTWTEDAPSAATISTTATCYFVTMGDKVVISDGTNNPWTWDGTDDVVLSNSPVLYGQPTVYYAKLFGIKNTERSTIVWSEEADPTTGYEAGGYNNAWTLGQTDQEALYAIRGTNEALYYWRARSTGAIRGKVDADFVNSGTREGVSQTVGSVSVDGIIEAGDSIFFFDADHRLHSLSISGGRITPLWEDLRETLSDWDETQLGDSRAVHYTPADHVLIGAVQDGSTECDEFVAVNLQTNDISGLWNGFTCTAAAMVKNASGQPVLMHGSANGYLYDHGLPTGSQWTDALNATDGGTTAIEHIVEGATIGHDIYVERKFDRWDVSLWLETAATLTMSYTTTRGSPTGQTPSQITASAYPREHHTSLGIDAAGRWIRPKITHQTGVERFGLERWCVRSALYGDEPTVP